ncbi:MAG TPA: DUF3459 domain-containing protein [Alphaproteobacteria bacterium]|nr:DUF3459 domain-containing protein [Alphaproteobacteria bacterium]
MPHQGVRRGEPSAYLPPTAFVSFLQNHDQIGNRPGGERISALVPPEVWRMMAAILLLSPQVPLLFMGEEWAATQPFFYFSDLQSLADSIRESRQKEFAFMPGWGPDTPDPLTETAVQRSTLDWSVLANEPHRQCLAHYRALIDVRRRRLVPRLVGMSGHSGTYEVIGGRGVRVRWILGDGSHLSLVANPSAQPIQGVELPPGECLWFEGTTKGRTLGPWSAIVILSAADGEEGG